MDTASRKRTGQTGVRRDEGFVLITGLLVLLMLTIIMLTSMRTAALEESMTGNLRNSNIAFQAAESALREAEDLIESNAAAFDVNLEEGEAGTPNPFHPFKLSGGPFQNTGDAVCAGGFCGPANPPASDSIRTMSDNALRTADTGIPGINQPQYVIELIFVEPSTDSRRLYATFRVTTRAWGEDPDSQVQLQSTYRSHVRSFIH